MEKTGEHIQRRSRRTQTQCGERHSRAESCVCGEADGREIVPSQLTLFRRHQARGQPFFLSEFLGRQVSRDFHVL